MKRYLLIIFAFISINAVGQSSYHPMLDSLTWVTQYYNFTGSWFTWYYSHGDTLINGNDYKIYYSGAYLREDTVARKVYKWNTTTNTDFLLYDFSMGVGDSILTTHGMAVVTGIDSLLTNAGYRDRWHLLWFDQIGNPYPLTVVEGIGSLVDPISMICLPFYDPQWYATCFYNHGIKTYGNLCPNYLTNFQFMVNPSHCGQCNGSAMVFATFIPDTLWWVPEYSWTQQGPAVIGGLCPLSTGTVVVTQTSTGFQYMDWYMIPDNPAPVIQNSNSIQASCSSCCDGSIVEIASSGLPPYSYSWAPNVSSTDSASGLCPGTYIITVTDSAGCSDQDTVVISFSTGIDLASNLQAYLYPNPVAKGEPVTIKNTVNSKMLTVIIFDQLGREVYRKQGGGNEVELSTFGLEPGMYFYRIEESGEVRAAGKLIIT